MEARDVVHPVATYVWTDRLRRDVPNGPEGAHGLAAGRTGTLNRLRDASFALVVEHYPAAGAKHP